MRIRILTTGTRWAATYGEPADGGETTVTVPDAAVEPVTFAGVAMLRFDMRQVSPRIPRDWPNPWAMVPAAHAVTD